MPIVLPPSLRRDEQPVAREVDHARELTPEQRLAVVAQVCRAAAKTLVMNAHRAEIVAARDPVPDSTRRAFQRLRSSGSEP